MRGRNQVKVAKVLNIVSLILGLVVLVSAIITVSVLTSEANRVTSSTGFGCHPVTTSHMNFTLNKYTYYVRYYNYRYYYYYSPRYYSVDSYFNSYFIYYDTQILCID